MAREIIDALIDQFTQPITTKQIENVRKIEIIVFVISLCLLLTIESYVFIIILFVLLIGKVAYLTVVKNKVLTVYRGVSVSFILCSNLALSFNIWLYSIQKLIGGFDPILFSVILFIETLCLIVGFFYSRRCVRKGAVRKSKAAAVASIVFVLPGAGGFLLARYISNEASVQIQNVFFTAAFALVSSMMMFTLGMVHVAIVYYIKKYDILDREISKAPVNLKHTLSKQ